MSIQSIGKEMSGADKIRDLLEREALSKNTTLTEIEKDLSNRAKFPGFPYELEARGESIIVNVDLFKTGYECKTCNGSRKVVKKIFSPGIGTEALEETCSDCSGLGVVKGGLVFAEESKSLPCTGVVVSVGPLVKDPETLLYKRVIFGPNSGRFIPISKAGVMMKIMDQREATAFVYGGEGLAAFDFIDIQKKLEEY